MSHLKSKNVDRCVGLLREFIEGASGEKKETAILALEQLQRICAGGDLQMVEPPVGCMGRPIMFNS